jgi:TolB-like protein/Flp pilus assembly protein TadD
LDHADQASNLPAGKTKRSQPLSFFKELKRRKVFQVAGMYAIVGWLLIQIADTSFGNLSLPDWSITLVIVLVVLGFPLALLLAWAYDITPDKGEGTAGRDSSAARSGTLPPPDSSVAVLAFADMSPAGDQEYFCEGTADEIINLLSQVDGLQVTSRTSSFQYKGKSTDIRTIGDELGVACILQGSVRKAGEQLRVAVQLIAVAGDRHLWSERYERPVKDIFRIQDDIAFKVVEALKLKLTPSAKKAMTNAPTGDLTAYDFYLRGKKYLRGFTRADLRFAVEMFDKAVGVDPGFALAFANLAYANIFLYTIFERDRGILDKARTASTQALSLDDSLAEAHCSMGLVLSEMDSSDQAIEAFETAIKLDPACFEAFHYYGRHSFVREDYDQAEKLLLRACELEPDVFHPAGDLLMTYSRMGRAEKAEEWKHKLAALLKKHVDLHPDDLRAKAIWACNRAEIGAVETAVGIADDVIAMNPEEPGCLYNAACAYSMAGRATKALDTLAKAIECGFRDKDWIRSDPELDPIREDDRFQALLERL